MGPAQQQQYELALDRIMNNKVGAEVWERAKKQAAKLAVQMSASTPVAHGPDPVTARAVRGLSRARLEELVLASVAASAPVPAAALAPEPTPKRVKIAAADPLVAVTGCFGWLSLDTFEVVLAAAPAVARLLLTTAVCKGLRAAGAAARPWTTLSAADAGGRSRPGPGTLRLCVGSGCGALARFVRDVSAQVERLDLCFNATPPDPTEIANVVAAAPNVTHLDLGGKRVLSDAIKRIRALPSIPRLRGLVLGEYCSNKTETVKMLSSASRLEELRIDNEVRFTDFEQACAAWRKARGGEPLLHRLVLMCGDWYLTSLGTACPGLRELEMRNVDFTFFGPEHPVCLPALRVLRLLFTGWPDRPDEERWIAKQHHMSDTPALLRRVFHEAPHVEELVVGWRTAGCSQKIVKTKHVAESLSALPRSLVTLELHGLALPWDALAGVDLPTLRTLTLVGCVRGGEKAHGPGLRALAARGVRIVELPTEQMR